MYKVVLYQILSLLDGSTWCTLYYNGGVQYAGYIGGVPDKFAKYPVLKIRCIDKQHLIVYIV